jgi:hypothetical protein
MGKLSVKFTLLTVIVVVLGISVLGWIMTRSLESEVRGRADQQATDQVEAILTVLGQPCFPRPLTQGGTVSNRLGRRRKYCCRRPNRRFRSRSRYFVLE